MRKYCLSLLMLPLHLLAINAQDTLPSPENHKWHFMVTPYLMIPGMSGDMGIGNLPDASIDLNAEDIFSRLQIGGMLYLEASHDHWAITSDVQYMKLKQDISATSVINSGKATMEQLAWEVAGLYKIAPWLEVGAGARLYNIGAEVEMNYKTGINKDTVRNESLTETWVDPIIIARGKFFTNSKWIAEVRADVGGFGIGSTFAWQIQADAGYRFSKLFDATIGYRYLDVNFENGTDTGRFLYDIATSGPTVRLGFTF